MPESVNQPNFIPFDIGRDLKALEGDNESSESGTANRAAQALDIITLAAAKAQSNHATLVALVKTAHDEAKAAHDDLMQKRVELEKGPQLDLIVEIGSRRKEIDAAQERVRAALEALGDAQMSWRGGWPAQARKLGVLDKDMQPLSNARMQQITDFDGPIRVQREALTEMLKRAEFADDYKYDLVIKEIEDRKLKINKVNTVVSETHIAIQNQLTNIAKEVKTTLAEPIVHEWRVPRLEFKINIMKEQLKTVHFLYGEIHSDLSVDERQSLESEIALLSVAVGEAQGDVTDCVAAVESARSVDSEKAKSTLLPLPRAPTSEDVGTPPETTLPARLRGWLSDITGAKLPPGGSA